MLLKRRKETHRHKLLQLTVSAPRVINNKPEFIPDFVINESNEIFSDEELNLLNKGLKFTPKPTEIPLLDTVVDIETVLKFKVPSVQCDIRSTADNQSKQ